MIIVPALAVPQYECNASDVKEKIDSFLSTGSELLRAYFARTDTDERSISMLLGRE